MLVWTPRSVAALLLKTRRNNIRSENRSNDSNVLDYFNFMIDLTKLPIKQRKPVPPV